jgi:hypothetical protein
MVIEDDPCHSPPHMPAYLGIIGYYSSPIAHVLGKHSSMSHDIGNNYGKFRATPPSPFI